MAKVVIGLLLLAVATAVGWLAYQEFFPQPEASRGGSGRGGGAALVVTDRVQLKSLPDEIEGIGTVVANESVTVTAKVTETVRAVNFVDGDYVERGTVLVELTNEEQTALLAEARANLDDARRQLVRLEDLAKQGSVPVSQVDEARSRFDASEARLEGIMARVADRLIRAPFSGLLGFREVSPGTLVTPNTAITTLDDISTVKLDFSVPENFFGILKAGLPVLAMGVAYPDRTFRGTVTSIGSRIDPVTRAVSVRAEFNNSERLLRPGMLMTVRLIQERAPSLVVAESAVVQQQDRSYVYRVIDGRARMTQITPGRRKTGVVEVLSGLEPGDEIVVDGITRVRDGVPVRIQGAEPPPRAGMQNGKRPGAAPPGSGAATGQGG